MSVTLTGQVSLVPATAILFMDADNKNRTLSEYKYKDEIVPILDVMYFVKKLDAQITTLLKTKDLSRELENDELRAVSSGVILTFPMPNNHDNQTFYSLNSIFCSKIVNEKAQSKLDISSYVNGNSCVRKIVDAELKYNGDYLYENIDNIKMRDRFAKHIIMQLQDEEGLQKWYTNDKKFCIDYYRNTGLKLVGSIMPENWDDVRDEALKALYFEYISSRKFDDYVKPEEFYNCVSSALKETEQNMQYVQNLPIEKQNS